MKIEISTDKRTEAGSDIAGNVRELVETGLARFKDRLTRVELHLSDTNGPKGGVDRRCAIEARPASQQPLAVNHEAETDIDAVRGAVDKMKRMLSSTFDRRDDHRGGVSASGLPT